MSLLPQFGFIELMVIAVVALIVVGPKDLPRLLRTCGQVVAKARRMAGEFTSAFDDMARETEMEELRLEMEALRFDEMADEVKDEVDLAFKPVSDEINQTVKTGHEETVKTSPNKIKPSNTKPSNTKPSNTKPSNTNPNKTRHEKPVSGKPASEKAEKKSEAPE